MTSSNAIEADVAIVGGGPAGSTCGAFVKKYRPDLRVAIIERERFPRDHIGESQLPMIGTILDELGVWDRIEACNFPVKIGATYRWGITDDLWDFDFLPYGKFEDEPRPAKYEGQRRRTAFQVDRSLYDKVLLDFAEEQGCEVHYRTQVHGVRSQGDRIDGLVLADGREVHAKYYIDASGHVGQLRRSMGVDVEEPSSLKNIAIWDYWRNAEWAESLGIGGTRIQVLSLGYGWIWFIPITPDRTSIGFVCPADYYKSSKLTPEQLYVKALAEEPRLGKLLTHASREGQVKTTKDWSFVSKRMTGENWLLVGEASGFADPILSAGMSLAHASAREAAFLVMEAERGGDLGWMREQYERRNDRRIRQHIRFADYWYRGNAHFLDLKKYTSEIARDAGLELNGNDAFFWLGVGGFVEEDMGVAGVALVRMDALHQISGKLSENPASSALHGHNLFFLNLKGAEQVQIARFEDGRVTPVTAYKRDGRIMVDRGMFAWLMRGLKHSPQFDIMLAYVAEIMTKAGQTFDPAAQTRLLECLDAMVRDGWVKVKRSEAVPVLRHNPPLGSSTIHKHGQEAPDQ